MVDFHILQSCGGETRTICKLGIRRRDDDIYFFEGPGPRKAHLSFHSDNSVWITPGVAGGGKSIQVFARQSDEKIAGLKRGLDERLSPFLAMKTGRFGKYPITEDKHRRYAYEFFTDPGVCLWIAFSVIEPSSNVMVPKSIEEICQLGVLKIGKPTTYDCMSVDGDRLKMTMPYAPIRIGPHILHVDVMPVSPVNQSRGIDFGHIVFCRLINDIGSSKQFLNSIMSLSIPVPIHGITKPQVKYRQPFVVNGVEMAELVIWG